MEENEYKYTFVGFFENPVIAYAIRSGDSFIFLYSIQENPVIAYAIRSGDSFILNIFYSLIVKCLVVLMLL
jgi:hypothetical protein